MGRNLTKLLSGKFVVLLVRSLMRLIKCEYDTLGTVTHGAAFQWLPSVGRSDANGLMRRRVVGAHSDSVRGCYPLVCRQATPHSSAVIELSPSSHAHVYFDPPRGSIISVRLHHLPPKHLG
jgi:hypothetical protein